MKFNKSETGFIIIFVSLALAAILSLNLYLRAKSDHDKFHISGFPENIKGWQARDIQLTEKEYEILETRNLILREYTNPRGKSLFLFIIYSETNRAVFHPPEVCLIGSGITIVDKKTEEVRFDKYAFSTNKLYLEKGKTKELVLYCYKAGKLYTDNFYLQQAYLAVHQLFGQLIPGATIRVSMAMNDREEVVLQDLKEFLKATITTLDKLS